MLSTEKAHLAPTIAPIPGLIEPFSQTSPEAEIYYYKKAKTHKVLHIERSLVAPGFYWLRDVYDMGPGWSLSRREMEAVANVLRKAGVNIGVLPYAVRSTRKKVRGY
jgi:hypothetical protein